MRVDQVMSRKVVTVEPDDPLRKAAELMADHRVSGLPVVSAGKMVGVLTESDFLTLSTGGRRRWTDILFGRSMSLEPTTVVGDLMTPNPVTIAADRRIRDAAKVMVDAGVKRLPVVDEDGNLIGIISRADVMKIYARSDTEIREEIADILHEYIVRGVEMDVVNGEVTMEGTVALRTESRLAEELVRRVDGVVSVTNRLAWDSDDQMI
jgi:predicted transcriptional regulator